MKNKITRVLMLPIVMVACIFIYLSIYRPPTEHELIDYLYKTHPDYFDISIIRFDEDVLNTYWYEARESKKRPIEIFGIECQKILVFPWENYFDKKIRHPSYIRKSNLHFRGCNHFLVRKTHPTQT